MSRYPHRILAEKHKRVQTQNSIEDKFLKQKLESFSREKLYIDRELRRISLARTSLLESLDRFNTIPKSTHKRLSLPCLIDGQGKEAYPRPISSLRRHTIPSFLEGVRAVAECKQSLKPRGREDTSLQSRKGSKPTLRANCQDANFVQGLTLKSQHKDHDTRGASPNKIFFTGQPYENKLKHEKTPISRQASEEDKKTRDRLQLPVLADSPAKPQLITPKMGSVRQQHPRDGMLATNLKSKFRQIGSVVMATAILRLANEKKAKKPNWERAKTRTGFLLKNESRNWDWITE